MPFWPLDITRLGSVAKGIDPNLRYQRLLETMVTVGTHDPYGGITIH
jgi:hypothetical protein